MNPSQADLIHFPIAFRTASPKLPDGTEASSGFVNIRGHARVQGHVFSDHPLDAGYPFVEFSSDGTNVDVSYSIPQDAAPLPVGYVYKIDLRNLSRFVRIRVKSTGNGASTVRLALFAEPAGGGPPS